MGTRCNLVVVAAGGWDLHYSHWAAVDLHVRLAPGPESALAFVQAQDRCAPDDWLDDRWAEGGALIDLDARRLLWFTTHVDDIEVHRAHRALLARTWPGWRVDTAVDGLGDLAAAVGVDRAVVRVAHPLTPPVPPAWEPEEIVAGPGDVLDGGPGSHQLVTVTGVDGATGAWITEVDGHALEYGPSALDDLPGPPFAHLRQRVIPECGLHADPATRRVGVWTSGRPLRGIADVLPARWQGWTVENWGDGVETHLDAARGAAEMPPVDVGRGARFLARALADERGDPVGAFGRTVDALRADGRTVEVTGAVDSHTETGAAPAELARMHDALADLTGDGGPRARR